MAQRLRDQTLAITGAARGIGLRTAELAAERAARRRLRARDGAALGTIVAGCHLRRPCQEGLVGGECTALRWRAR